MSTLEEIIEKLEQPIERSVYSVGEMYVTIDATPGQVREARAELSQMTAVIEAARLQNSVWHSPAVTAALSALDKVKVTK